MQEAIVEDRPVGFVFADHWIPTRYIHYNVLDLDFRSLQEFVDLGVSEAVQLKLDPKHDKRHFEYIATKEMLEEVPLEVVPSVKYSNIIKPGELLCFHLVRYSASTSAITGSSPRLAAMQVEYPETLTVVGQTYRLQAVVVHEAWQGLGNAGHYYTFARTQDVGEPWVELNDKRVFVVSQQYVLSKTSTATLLFYARQQDSEDENKVDLAAVPFIQRSRKGTNMLRAAIADAIPFSHDFRPSQFLRATSLLYESKGYSKQSVRQALALGDSVGPDLIPELEKLEKERRSFATERLLDMFPDRFKEISEVLNRHNGSYQEALLELLQSQEKK